MEWAWETLKIRNDHVNRILYLITSDEIFPLALTLLVAPIEASGLHSSGDGNPKQPIVFNFGETSVQLRSDPKQLLRLLHAPRREPPLRRLRITADSLKPTKRRKKSMIAIVIVIVIIFHIAIAEGFDRIRLDLGVLKRRKIWYVN